MSSYLHLVAQRFGILIIAICILAIMVTAPVAADEPRTSEEFFQEFQSLEGDQAFQEFSEFESIRTFAVTRSQETGSLNPSQQRELFSLYTGLRSFSESHEHLRNDQYQQALSSAENVEESIDVMADSGAETEASMAKLGLTQFYREIAEQSQSEADAADNTPAQIELLSTTATAYQRAGLPDQAGQFRAEVERLEAEYSAATEAMDEAENSGSSVLESCTNCQDLGFVLSSPAAAFTQYNEISTTRTITNDAVQQAEIHGVLENRQELSSVNNDINTAWRNFVMIISATMLLYATIIALIAMVLFSRILTWESDFDQIESSKVVNVGDTHV